MPNTITKPLTMFGLMRATARDIAADAIWYARHIHACLLLTSASSTVRLRGYSLMARLDEARPDLADKTTISKAG